MSSCLFCTFVRKEAPVSLVFEDERAIAFRDIDPKAPTHLLIVPRRHIPSVQDVTPEDEVEVGHLFTVASKLAVQEGLDVRGYRTVFNVGDDAGQTVPHLHLHLIGGRAMGWPPFPR